MPPYELCIPAFSQPGSVFLSVSRDDSVIKTAALTVTSKSASVTTEIEKEPYLFASSSLSLTEGLCLNRGRDH